MARAPGVLLAAVVALVPAGCSVVGRSDDPVGRRIEQTHRFDVDLTGAMPTREQLGVEDGRSTASFSSSQPIAVTFSLAGGRQLAVPASTVVVTTAAITEDDARSPSGRPYPPNEVSATQDVSGRDEARDLLLAQADVLGLDTDEIGLWYTTAPEKPGPDVLLAKTYFSGRARIGYVDVGAGVFIADTAYIIWYLSWDPPLPGARPF